MIPQFWLANFAAGEAAEARRNQKRDGEVHIWRNEAP